MGLIRLLILNEHQRFKWRGSKNPHRKDTYLNEIGLCAQNLLHALGQNQTQLGDLLRE